MSIIVNKNTYFNSIGAKALVGAALTGAGFIGWTAANAAWSSPVGFLGLGLLVSLAFDAIGTCCCTRREESEAPLLNRVNIQAPASKNIQFPPSYSFTINNDPLRNASAPSSLYV